MGNQAKGTVKIVGDAKLIKDMFRDIGTSANKTEKKVTKSGKKMSKDFDKDMKKMKKSAKGLMTYMKGAFALSMVKVVADQVKTTERLALAKKFLAQNNKMYSDSIDDMVKASSGHLLASDAITISNTLHAAGIKLTRKQLIGMTEDATIMANKLNVEVAPTMVKLAKGIALNRRKLVDDLIPALKSTTAQNEETAKSLGKTVGELTEMEKTVGRTNSTLNQLKQQVSDVDREIMKTGSRFTGQITDIVSGINLLFGKYLEFLNYVAKGSEEWGERRADAVYAAEKVEREAYKRLTLEYKKGLFEREGLTLDYFKKQVEIEMKANKKITAETQNWYNTQLEDYLKYKEQILAIDETDSYNPFEVVKKDLKKASELTSKEQVEEKKRKKAAVNDAKRAWKERYDIALSTLKVSAKEMSDFEDGEAFLKDKKRREQWARETASDKDWTKKKLEDRLIKAAANYAIDKKTADKIQEQKEKREENNKAWRQKIQEEKVSDLKKEQEEINNILLKMQQNKEALAFRYLKLDAKKITDFKTAQAYTDSIINKEANIKKLLETKSMSEKELEIYVLTTEYKKAIADKEEKELMDRGARIFAATQSFYGDLMSANKNKKDVEEQIRKDELNGIERTEEEKRKMRDDAEVSVGELAQKIIANAMIQAGGEVYADGIKTMWKGGAKLFNPVTAGIGAGEVAYGAAQVAAGLGMGYVGTAMLPDTSATNESKEDAASDRAKDIDTKDEANVNVFMYKSERERLNQLAKAQNKIKDNRLGKRR